MHDWHIFPQVANKKQRDTAAADAEMMARRAAKGESEGATDEQPKDMLADADEDEVIF